MKSENATRSSQQMREVVLYIYNFVVERRKRHWRRFLQIGREVKEREGDG